MNITQETNDYFSTTEEKIVANLGNIWDKNLPESIVKDKLKCTPSAGLLWVRKSFRVDWNKLFKKK